MLNHPYTAGRKRRVKSVMKAAGVPHSLPRSLLKILNTKFSSDRKLVVAYMSFFYEC